MLPPYPYLEPRNKFNIKMVIPSNQVKEVKSMTIKVSTIKLDTNVNELVDLLKEATGQAELLSTTLDQIKGFQIQAIMTTEGATEGATNETAAHTDTKPD